MTCGVIFGAKVLSASVAQLWIGLLFENQVSKCGVRHYSNWHTPGKNQESIVTSSQIFFSINHWAIVFRRKLHQISIHIIIATEQQTLRSDSIPFVHHSHATHHLPLALARRHGMLLKGDVASTLFTISISEGLVRQLDPTFDVAEQALPYITKYMGSGKKLSSWRPPDIPDPSWMEMRWWDQRMITFDEIWWWNDDEIKDDQKIKPSEKPGKQPGAGWATWLTLVGQHSPCPPACGISGQPRVTEQVG